MLPLKLTILQIKPYNTQLHILVNEVPYTAIRQHETKYICADLQHDVISLQTNIDTPGAQAWQIDSQTITDSAVTPQELAICPNDSLMIRFQLSSLKVRHRQPPIYHVTEQFENTFDVQESSIDRYNTQKEQNSSAIVIREKNSIEPSSTMEPDTIDMKPVCEKLLPSVGMPKLDELAQQRQRIINELFGKLRLQRQSLVL